MKSSHSDIICCQHRNDGSCGKAPPRHDGDRQKYRYCVQHPVDHHFLLENGRHFNLGFIGTVPWLNFEP